MRKRLALLLIATLMMGACASVSTDSDEAAIAYSGGPIEGVKFDKIIGPGSGRIWLGIGDNKYVYPTTTRTYIVSQNATEGDRGVADQINATSADGATIGWEVAVYFKLNLSLLREFHENIGQKYDAYKDDGWRQMLNDTLRQQLESALQSTSREYTVEEYRKNPDVLTEINQAIAQDLKDNVNEVLGNDYFCGPTFTGTVDDDGSVGCPDFEVVVKRPNFPQQIEDEYNNQVAARQAVVTAQRQAEKLLEEAEGKAQAKIAGAQGELEAARKILELLQNPNYVSYLRAQAMLQCASSPNCTLVVTPSGEVNVNTGRQQ